MTRAYLAISQDLWSTANYAAKYLRETLGATHIKYEEELQKGLSYQPLIHGKLRDLHWVCVEVSSGGYTQALDSFVLDCKNGAIPVKLYIAYPKNGSDTQAFKELVRKARNRGVGIMEIDGDGDVDILAVPLSLSLAGVRRVVLSDFPSGYRHALAEAETTFLNGDPVKGCARVYDELERASRRLASKIEKRGLWKKNVQPKCGNFELAPWKKVLEDIRDCARLGDISGKEGRLSETLVSNLIGITAHRNDAGHKPESLRKLIRRDREMRTRFESAVDLLRDFLAHAGHMRL